MGDLPENGSRSRLARLARRGAGEAEPGPDLAEERCELCSAPLPPEHRHLLDLRSRELMCACRACSTLFDRDAAGGEHFSLVGDRLLRLDDFEMSEAAWEELRIPVEIAFFFRNSAEQRVVAYYPGPMGPTESQLGLEAWEQLEADNQVLATMVADVEALLVNRAHGARRQWLVGVDECYRLTGLIRMRWKGLGGGRQVWEEVGAFFDDLDRRAKPPPEASNPTATAAAPGPGRR
ncbi:MAG: DUF5947 family protein [Solirubrobacterales bacterium]